MPAERGCAIRTFIAIHLPDGVKEALSSVQSALDRGFRNVSWSRPDSIHLTLKFLGEIADEKASQIASELEKAASGIRPFTAVVEGVGGFPNQRIPRVVWAGVRENAELIKLQGNVEERLSSIGFEREDRPFSPHLTLCRIKAPEDSRAMGRLLAELKPQVKAEFEVKSFYFMKSVLRPKGAEYTIIKELALTGQSNSEGGA